MFEKKTYVVDTNVLIHCPSCIKRLSEDNNNVIIPYTVMCELDKLKKEIRISHVVYEVINELSKYRDKLKFLPQFNINKNASLDENIVIEIKNNNLKDAILLTNDILFDIAADKIHELKSEELRDANPFKSESEKITGIINLYDDITGEKVDLRSFPNTFYFEEGKPFFYDGTDNISKSMNFEHNIWKVKPRNIYQNFAFELIENPNINIVSINSAAGLGKAQPIDAQILTPNGYIDMGDIQIGDYIFNRTGKKQKVLGIFPQGKKEVYQITFTDGSTTECCKEHLWLIQNENQRQKDEWVLREFKEIYRMPLTRSCSKQQPRWKRHKLFIPMTEPIRFEEKKVNINPYLLGVLLGDGCITQNATTITSADSEIIQNCEKVLNENYKINKYDDLNYAIISKDKKLSFSYIIKEIGLYRNDSKTKFIPTDYLYNSIENRVSILQGLMDTDGSAEKSGLLTFCTVSETLADNFKFLINSLGGHTTLHTKKCWYIKNNTRYYTGTTSYNFNITLPQEIIPFRLQRKLDIYNTFKKISPRRAIHRVDYIGEKECQCIYVDGDHTYLTDNCIVTHNTLLSLSSALHQMLETKKYKKIILIKPLVEIGSSIGFLPGNVDEKIAPYYEYIESLIIKLHELRPANKLFRNQADKDNKIDYANLEFNPRKFQILPATFLRGANIEDAFVIIDEAQNFARDEMRAILTRLGENCKCVILGDTNQVDNRFLNSDNNGLNWVVKKFFGYKNYAHLCLKGDKSRGPICDLVLKSGL